MNNRPKYIQFTDKAPLIEAYECEKCHVWSINKECKSCTPKEKEVVKK